jgi:hypothetical protein
VCGALSTLLSLCFYALFVVMHRYIDELEGVALSYSNVRVLEKDARIINEFPHMHFHIRADILLFCPKVGTLLGK